MKKFFSVLLLISAIAHSKVANAQQDDDLVQFAGVVVTADSSRLIPLVSIRLKGSNRGSYTDASGFFSVVVKKSDTIVFSSIGLKTVEYVIPKEVKGTKFSIVQPMTEDTIYLPNVVIRPGPTAEEFNYYFVKANIPDEYFSRANNNLRSKTLQGVSAGMSMDAQENQLYYQQSQAYQYYSNGQLPPQRLFDPIAWSQFFNSWKQGEYKKK